MSGRARAWAVVNWPADQLLDVSAEAERQGVSQPCAAQLPYSLVRRSPVEDDDMRRALSACGAPVIASFVMAGGVLTGKYADDPHAGRAAGTLDHPAVAQAAEVGSRLAELAHRLGHSPATLAVAFALANPDVASVLFGATSPDQVRENAAAPAVLDRLGPVELESLASLAMPR
jgi:aryl-alcohol dehydrogenase-like predicted oxidoreductase